MWLQQLAGAALAASASKFPRQTIGLPERPLLAAQIAEARLHRPPAVGALAHASLRRRQGQAELETFPTSYQALETALSSDGYGPSRSLPYRGAGEHQK